MSETTTAPAPTTRPITPRVKRLRGWKRLNLFGQHDQERIAAFREANPDAIETRRAFDCLTVFWLVPEGQDEAFAAHYRTFCIRIIQAPLTARWETPTLLTLEPPSSHSGS